MSRTSGRLLWEQRFRFGRTTDLKHSARASGDANQTRRLLALSVIYDGGRRSEAAQIGGVGRQIIRDWVERSNGQGPGGLIDRKAPGNPSKLNDE